MQHKAVHAAVLLLWAQSEGDR